MTQSQQGLIDVKLFLLRSAAAIRAHNGGGSTQVAEISSHANRKLNNSHVNHLKSLK